MTGIRCSGIFIVNLEHISHLLLVFLLLTLNKLLAGMCMKNHDLQKALSNLLSVNNKAIITDNVDLLNKALLSSGKASCIAGLCRKCQESNKLGR